MRKLIFGTIGSIAIILAVLSINFFIFQEDGSLTHVSAKAVFGSDTGVTIPTEVGVKGSTTNPFVILEIVPYEGYAEIGYMIKGCEPVPMDKVTLTSDAATAASTGGFTCGPWTLENTFDLPVGDKVGSNQGEWQIWGNKNQYGYYQKVTAGEGTFVKTVVGTATTFVETENGDYNWVPYEVNIQDPTKSTDYNADQVHTYRVRTYYQRYRYFITYNNKFLLETLKVSAADIDNYNIQVVTITPEKLNMASEPNNQAWIDRADLVYFSPNSHFGASLTSIWAKYYSSKVVSNPPTNFASNDITWETTVKLLKKTSVDADPAPIIFDVNVFTSDNSYSGNIMPKKAYSNGAAVTYISSKGYLCNVAKLYMVMQQMEPAKFYHEYIATGLVKSVAIKKSDESIQYNGTVAMTTGYYTEQSTSPVTSSTYYKIGTVDSNTAAAIWSIYTFLPYQYFADYAALDSNNVWATLGIDNYRVIVDGGASNVSVRHNMYSYNGDNPITIHFTDPEIGLNQYRKEAFDFYNKTSGTITPAEAIYFLLNFATAKYDQTTLRILEIEPCNDFVWDGTDEIWNYGTDDGNGSIYARQYYTKYFPNYTGGVKITTITSAEFIGVIEDLNANYDMILFGLQDGVMKKNGTLTDYNDNTKDGKVYLHNGDIVTGVKTKLQGLNGSNTINSYRFSGNDITKMKLSELLKFMGGGNPIILDNGFYTSSSRASINTTKIDINSFVYDLTASSNSQLFYSDGISTDALEASLSAANFQITFGKVDDSSVLEQSCYPVVYKDKTKPENADLSLSDIYINATDQDFRTLQYKFYINDYEDSNINYTVKLYIDINADGKFDELTENISNLNILNDQGYSIKYSKLESGVNYTVTRNLEDEYFGVLPWKLVVSSNSNLDKRDSVINYCALKAQDKITLNILQIMSDPVNTTNSINLATQPVFQKYIADLNDFEINIVPMTVTEISNLCGTGTYTYLFSDDNDNSGNIGNLNNGIDDDGDGIYDYDMLILGFADMYSDISNTNLLTNIADFIEEGRTVLFTHDTTSFVNLSKASYPVGETDYWGYGLNKNFRGIFGMDRFGVTLSTSAERIAAQKDYAANESDYSGYIQGYSNIILDRYAPSGQNGSHKNMTLASNVESNFFTTYVSNVNKGQITKYPYLIDDNFTVANTHAQYYQLDMESDDIVVWYCLSDNSSTESGLYSTTPNDVRNNYYIYNKGNITYSGVGHSAFNSNLSDTSNHTEVKLFVNTIIAAYTATAKEPEIVISNPDKSIDADGKEYVYVDYDIYNTEQAVGTEVTGTSIQQQRVKYRVIDNNILFNKVLTVKYYYADTVTNGGISTTTETEITDLTTKTVSDDAAMTKVAKGEIIESGEEYYIDIPLAELKDKNSGRTIVIKVVTTYGKASDKTVNSVKPFILIRRGLFDLD